MSNCTAGTLCAPPQASVDARLECFPSYYCPENTPARLCPSGQFCPNTTTLLECPEGYFCPPGTIHPRMCSPFATCPAGSERYFLWGGLLLMLLVIPVSWLLYRAYQRWMTARQQRVMARKTGQGSESGPLLLEDEAAKPSSHPPAMASGIAMDLRFEELRSEVEVAKTKRTIMDGVSGEFTCGRLTAIMGPSGAGKTTLISLLTGKVPQTGGRIFINGVQDSLKNHRRVVGFVPQHDTMISTLTVRDILVHSAMMRLPTDWAIADRLKRVEDVMALLGIARIQHSIVGDEIKRGISGGEKKRVNIGIELVANPSILFLDEPTTGLDSTTSVDVTRLLRDIARLHVTVVSILHQPRPEIFQMLDDLLLLAPGGKTVYFGLASETLNYFNQAGFPCPKRMNPADWFMDVISGKCGGPLTAAEVALAVEEQRTPSIKQRTIGAALALPALASIAEQEQDQEHKESATGHHAGRASMHMAAAKQTRRNDDAKWTQAVLNQYLCSHWLEREPAMRRTHATLRSTNANGNGKALPAPSSSSSSSSSSSAADPASPTASPASPASATTSLPDAQEAYRQLQAYHKRAYPHWGTQVALFVKRGLTQHVHTIPNVALELYLHMVCGLVLGVAFVYQHWFLPPLPYTYWPWCPEAFQRVCREEAQRDQLELNATYVVMAVGLTAAVIGNRNFGHEINNFFREASTGVSTSAYVIGKSVSDFPLILTYSFFFCLSFATVCAPQITFEKLFTTILLYELVVFALGYVSSILMKSSENGLLLSAIAALLSGLGVTAEGIKFIVWSRWFGEAFAVSEMRAEEFPPNVQYVITLYHKYGRTKYDLDNYQKDLLVLLLFVVVFRLMTYGALTYRRIKQKV